MYGLNNIKSACLGGSTVWQSRKFFPVSVWGLYKNNFLGPLPFPSHTIFASISLYFVYVCDVVQICVVNVLGFESRFSLRYYGQFYSTNSLWVRPLESWCVLLVLPSTIPLVTTIWYCMVLDSKYHRIYGTIESMVPAQLWAMTILW